MVEFSNDLPVVRTVTLLAFLAETSLMGILVTRDACVGNAEKTLVQVFHPDSGTLTFCHTSCRVALLATSGRVLALQWPSCFCVIESLERRLPSDQIKVLSVVLGVAG